MNIGNHSFVMINAPGLVDEDGRRAEKEVSYEHWAAALPGGPIEYIRSQSPSARVYSHHSFYVYEAN